MDSPFLAALRTAQTILVAVHVRPDGDAVASLGADLGAKRGCGACLHSLNRIRSGEFDLADAYDIETMRTWEQPELENAVNDFLHKKLQRMNLSAF